MIVIPMAYIRSAMAIIDLKAKREYERGVWVEFEGVESRIVSTNGAVLFVARFECDKTLDSGTFLDGNELKRVHKNAESIHLAKDGTWSSDTVGGVSITGKAYPGVRYPDWRNVLPRGAVSGKPATFDPSLLARLEKAGGYFALSPNGSAPAIAFWSDMDMFAIINPRNERMLPDALESVPGWVRI